MARMVSKAPQQADQRSMYKTIRAHGLRAYDWKASGIMVHNNHGKPMALIVVRKGARASLSSRQSIGVMSLLALGLPCYVWTKKDGLRLVVDERFDINHCASLEKTFHGRMFKRSLKLVRPIATKDTDEQAAVRFLKNAYPEG